MASNNNNENSDSGMFEHARDWMHENVRPPPEEQEHTKEIPVPDKVKDELLSSVADAGTSTVNTMERATQTVKDAGTSAVKTMGHATQTVKDKVPFGKQQQPKDDGASPADPRPNTTGGILEKEWTPHQSPREKVENEEVETTVLGRLKEKLETMDADNNDEDGNNDDDKPKADDPPAFLDGERIDEGFEEIKEKLPREINTLSDKAGAKITDGFEQVKEALPNKLEQVEEALLEPQEETKDKKD